jgi:CelD/BcsL family acetyltransferase involved in cellulose biosynthesis
VTVEVVRDDSTAVLPLPADFTEWLTSIGKKERHEVRRKRRKCAAELGPLRVARDSTPQALETFVRMHRAASGEKGTFMNEDLERFFVALTERTGAVVDTLTAGDRPVAAVFGWASDDAFYIYNSAYEPELRSASPGAVLASMLVEREIQRGATRLDFLKGDEPYKYRLGAVARPLYRLEGRFP